MITLCDNSRNWILLLGKISKCNVSIAYKTFLNIQLNINPHTTSPCLPNEVLSQILPGAVLNIIVVGHLKSGRNIPGI